METKQELKERFIQPRKPSKVCVVLFVIKYLIAAALTILAAKTTSDWKYILIGLCELGAIFFGTNALLRGHKVLAKIFNVVLLLAYNTQMTVACFGSSFLTWVMLTNVDSLEDLSGKAVIYGCGCVAVIISAVLPIIRISSDGLNKGLSTCLLLELCFTLILGNMYSPLYNLCAVAKQGCDAIQTANEIANTDEDYSQLFYSGSVGDYRVKDETIPDNMNVILIMTEGLSQNIVDDERNIMPNLRQLESQSLYFDDYYNHTFATYRGIIGQLFSGYQLNNLDANHLISLQSIFGDLGYSTAFINTEPLNTQFTAYINNLGFQEVLGGIDSETKGLCNSISDKDAYAMMFEEAEEREAEGQPFFLSMYTFGTHASLYSVDEVYGDGSNGMLNKFYNVDCWLGNFLEKFNNSPISDNTLLVFTADHATYGDSDYASTFAEHNGTRVCPDLDEIPLCFYYKGVIPQVLPVEGRNSVDLAPTLLDYLDISAPNYFLGMSLFAPKQNNNNYDTVFYVDESLFYTSDSGTVAAVPDDTSMIIKDLITKYFVAAQKEY